MQSYIILFIFGIIILLITLAMDKKHKNMAKTGEKAEGLVDRIEIEKGTNVRYPVIVFYTKDQQQISKKYEESMYAAGIKTGGKVMVNYNPANPKEFIIYTRKSRQMYITMFAAGILFMLTAIFLYLNDTVIHLLK